jgi:hypothetical protein
MLADLIVKGDAESALAFLEQLKDAELRNREMLEQRKREEEQKTQAMEEELTQHFDHYKRSLQVPDGEKQSACQFYLRSGCCRWGDKCNKPHPYPPISRFVLLPNMYQGIPLESDPKNPNKLVCFAIAIAFTLTCTRSTTSTL